MNKLVEEMPMPAECHQNDDKIIILEVYEPILTSI